MKEKMKEYLLENGYSLVVIIVGCLMGILHIEGWGWIVAFGAFCHTFE